MFDELFFEIKSGSDFLKLEPIKFLFEDSSIDWDNNWLVTKFSIKCGCFYGDYFANIMTLDYENLKQNLIPLYNNLDGNVDFNDLENNISMKIKGDGIGHFFVDCICSDNSYFDANSLH